MEANVSPDAMMTETVATGMQRLTRPLGRRDLLTRTAVLGLAAPVLGRAALPAAAQEGPAGTVTFALLGDPTLNPFTWPNQLRSILVAKGANNHYSYSNPVVDDLLRQGRIENMAEIGVRNALLYVYQMTLAS